MAKDLISSFLPTAEIFPNRPLTLQVGATFGPFYINLFATRPTLIGTYTVVAATDIFTITSHGLSNGDMVQVTPATATSNVTDGLNTGELYFIINASTNTFKLALTSGGSAVDVKDATTGKLYKCGTPFDATNCAVWAWVKHLRTDPDNDIVLNLNPTFTGASYGFGYDWRITFTKTKTETFSLSPNVHVWSLLLGLADGTRRLLIDNSRFTIALPSTHPPASAIS